MLLKIKKVFSLIMKKRKKILESFVSEGFFYTFQRGIWWLRKHQWNQEREELPLKQYLNLQFPDLQPIFFTRLPESSRKKRINLVTDALGSSLLGGVGTALLLASKFAVRENMSLRIITRLEKANPTSYFDFMRLMHEPTPEKVEFWSDALRSPSGQYSRRLELAEDEIFFTTSWWTTQIVKEMKLPCKIFYIVQEVEPFFYPYNDQHLWCSQLLKDPHIDYLVNSHWLFDYFTMFHPNIVQHGVCFEPAFPRHLYSPKQKKSIGKHKLFYYARQFHPRNLFFTGIKVLDQAINQGIIDTNHWEVCLAGAPITPSFIFSTGYKPTFMGKMSWAEYSSFLGEVDLTFSLMYTPHPSYPPLDTIASGGVCVTNSFANKTECKFCKNLIFCDLTPESLCNGLAKGIQLALNESERQENFKNSTLPSSWSETLASTLQFMKDRYQK